MFETLFQQSWNIYSLAVWRCVVLQIDCLKMLRAERLGSWGVLLQQQASVEAAAAAAAAAASQQQ